MTRTILHIDFDSFFASVEQQYDPFLRGKPIGVTARNGRTCIIASSREAKRFGVKTATRTYEAKKLCPEILLVPADFTKYFTVSKRFLNICKNYSPFVELFSIDELFMDVTKTAHLFGGTFRMIALIKDQIQEEIGDYITASFGISYNKLLAKLASGLQKPNGMVAITEKNLDTLFEKAKLTDICGIGERISQRLNQIGIYTLLELRSVSFEMLVRAFGTVEATFLKSVSFGIDTNPVVSYTTPIEVKSVSRNYCLPRNEYNQQIILQHVYELCEEIGIKLRRLKKKTRTIGLSLRGHRHGHGRKTIGTYINTGFDIFSICKNLYQDWQWGQSSSKEENMVRMISVWAGNLEDASFLPQSLFERSQRREHLAAVVDKINDRFGDHTIRPAFLLYAEKLTTVPNGYLADKFEREKLSHEQFAI